MIFVTLGTQGKDFSRCLKAVESLIDSEKITEEVIAQTGNTSYKPHNIKCIDFLNEADFQRYINDASLIITHAGTGAIFSSMKYVKPIIAIARLAKYGEMVNDHQTEIVKKLTDEGYILNGTFNLQEAWEKSKTFIPRPFDLKCNMANRIKSLIDEWTKPISKKT